MSEETIVEEAIAQEEPEVQDQEIDQPEPPKEETEQEKYSKRVQKRIDKLEWEKNEEKRQRYALEQELESLRSAKPQKQSNFSSPNPDDFAAGRYDPDYLEALTDYKAQQAIDNFKKSVSIDENKKRVAELQHNAKQQYTDYDDVTEEFLSHPLSNVAEFNELLMDADNPIELAYFLGKNPDELDKIADMTPAQAARYIGRLEAQIEQKPKSLEQDKKPASNAPKPVSPVGSAKPSIANKDIYKMSANEYIKYSLEQSKK